MCKFKSVIITKNGVKVAPMNNDSHSALLKTLGIKDDFFTATKVFVRAELIPQNGDKSTDVSTWEYRVDQDIVPDWYGSNEEYYEKEVREAVAAWMEKNFATICGKLCVKIKEDNDREYYMLADSLFNAKFGINSNYQGSSLRAELQTCTFAKELKKKYGTKLIPCYGENDILGVRTIELHNECKENIPSSNCCEWLASADVAFGAGALKCMSTEGKETIYWYCNMLGVRPYFILKK